MDTVIDTIRKRLRRSGWSTGDAKLVTLDGGVIWAVTARRNDQFFSAQGETQVGAWEAAWQMAEHLHGLGRESPGIVPLRRRTSVVGRAG
jgi:hypothetical protein